MQIVWLSPNDLHEHSQQGVLFRGIEGEDWKQFVADVAERGILQPIVISRRTGVAIVVDGHQRWRAAKQLELELVPCVEHPFAEEREEVRHLVMNNVRRRQLSRAEVNSAVAYYLLNFTHWVDRRIGEEVGASHPTVRKQRLRLEAAGKIYQLPLLEGANGKLYPRSIAPEKTHKTSSALQQLARGAQNILAVPVDKGLEALSGDGALHSLLVAANDHLGAILRRGQGAVGG